MESKKLNVVEFQKVLQLEYISCKVRGMIFEKPCFIKMNMDIAEKKKEKIEDLSRRFRIENIFSSHQYFQDLYNKEFLNEFGLPNFQYSRDEIKRLSQEFWDKKYLFKPDTSVIYQGIDTKVVINDCDNECVILALDKNTKVHYSELKVKDLMTAFGGRLP